MYVCIHVRTDIKIEDNNMKIYENIIQLPVLILRRSTQERIIQQRFNIAVDCSHISLKNVRKYGTVLYGTIRTVASSYGDKSMHGYVCKS